MRSVCYALLLGLTAGLFGISSNASAAPVSGAAIVEAGSAGAIVEEAQWTRRRCGWVIRRVHRPFSRTRVWRTYRCFHR